MVVGGGGGGGGGGGVSQHPHGGGGGGGGGGSHSIHMGGGGSHRIQRVAHGGRGGGGSQGSYKYRPGCLHYLLYGNEEFLESVRGADGPVLAEGVEIALQANAAGKQLVRAQATEPMLARELLQTTDIELCLYLQRGGGCGHFAHI